MERLAVFLFLSAAAVSFFTFLTVSHWISTTSAERGKRDRLMLLRRIAEQPGAGEAMRELLRDEEARAQAQARQRALEARRDGLQGGATIIAAGVGLSVFLYLAERGEPVWAVGIIVVLSGAVTAAFAYARPIDVPDESEPDDDH